MRPARIPIKRATRGFTARVPYGKVARAALRCTNPFSPKRNQVPANPPDPTKTALIRAASHFAPACYFPAACKSSQTRIMQTFSTASPPPSSERSEENLYRIQAEPQKRQGASLGVLEVGQGSSPVLLLGRSGKPNSLFLQFLIGGRDVINLK